MRFQAQIKSVTIRETPSSDAEVRVVLITEDRTALELTKYIAEDVVDLEVKNEQ